MVTHHHVFERDTVTAVRHREEILEPYACLFTGAVSLLDNNIYSRTVGSLLVRALDSGPEGLGSMPVPPNTLRVYTEYVLVKSVGPKVLWAESRVQGNGENFPPLQFQD
ncbi:uncharacterized protein TNCV_3168821 [Trichonephila clavipes]|nr:uncharacterized protein TNCV_3168821 [Trichonephila clavipes]